MHEELIKYVKSGKELEGYDAPSDQFLEAYFERKWYIINKYARVTGFTLK